MRSESYSVAKILQSPVLLYQLISSLACNPEPIMAEMGFKFADVQGIANLGRRPWSKSAPAWRKTKHGLCLEGICKSPSCVACNKKVIHTHGFTGKSGFVLEEDSPTIKCPMCAKNMDPTTCAFNNCDWKVEGKKWLGYAKGVQRVNEPYQKADDAYFVFDDNVQVNWLSLKIIVLPNGQGCTEPRRLG